jgi:TetR/AcrR family transcriptional regulator, cholesterol catabolism regulator
MTEGNDRRELILSTAAKLFARRGLRATTVRQIADAVGLFSGSLYYYFPSKDAIIDELLTRYLDAIKSRYAMVLAADKSPAEILHDLVVTSLEVADEHPHAQAIYQNEGQFMREVPGFEQVQTAAADVQQTWLRVIEAGVADGSFRDDIPPRVFYRLIRDAVWLSVRWQRPDGPYTTTQLADDITSIFLDGFAATVGERSPAHAAKKTNDSTKASSRAWAGKA